MKGIIWLVVPAFSLMCVGCSGVNSVPGYLDDGQGSVILNQHDQCWRTAEWQPSMAIPQCDPVIAAKEKTKEKQEEAVPPEEDKTPPAEGNQPKKEEKTATTPVKTGPPSVQPEKKPDQPEPLAPIVPEFKSLTLSSDILFHFDQASLTRYGREIVNKLAKRIKADHIKDLHITISGYTDRIGTRDYNLDLSERRAAAVKQAMVARKLPPAAIDSFGMGERMPVTSARQCRDDFPRKALIACLTPDRRVVIDVRGHVKTSE